MSHPVVFVGGPKDGLRLTLQELIPTMHFDHLDSRRVLSWAELTMETPQLPIRRLTYNLQRFRGEEAVHAYYQFDGMTGDQAIESLLANYRPERGK